MTETARRLLVDGGTCPASKVRVVPHGAPTVLAAARRATPERAPGDRRPSGEVRRRRGRFLLSTFGLISPGKGLETAIEALPSIVERHPEVLYVIAGRTHPDVARREGERYRLTLEQAVSTSGSRTTWSSTTVPQRRRDRRPARRDRRLRDAVPRARADLVGRAHVRHRRRLRASSRRRTGTRRTCSHRGPARSCRSPIPAALADAVCRYIEEPGALGAARAEARRIGAELAWPSVAEATAAVLREAVELAPRRRRPVARARPAARRACAPTTCSRSSTTSASSSTRTA